MNKLKNDRIIIELNPGFYAAEIYDYNRNFKYDSMCCGNCEQKVFTEFYADLIPDEVVKKVNFKPDITLDNVGGGNRYKFMVCDNCFNIYVTDNFVGILEEDNDNITYSYKIDNDRLSLSNKLFTQLKLYFWQTQKEPIEIIIDEMYHDKIEKFLDSKLLDEFNEIYSKYLEICNKGEIDG